MNDHAAGASPVDRTVRPAAEARWYCLDRDGVAMLCKDEADARAQVIESDDLWPARAPHRAALLGDVAAERERCAAKAGEYARKWWTEHCRSNHHMATTRKAHDDFCALQVDIRRA